MDYWTNKMEMKRSFIVSGSKPNEIPSLSIQIVEARVWEFSIYISRLSTSCSWADRKSQIDWAVLTIAWIESNFIVSFLPFRPSCAHWSRGWMLCPEHQLMDSTIISVILSIINTFIITLIKPNRCRNYRMRSVLYWSSAIWLSKPFLISNIKWLRQAQIVQLPDSSRHR